VHIPAYVKIPATTDEDRPGVGEIRGAATGEVRKVLGPVTYLVENNENVCKKHVNQMMEKHTMDNAQSDMPERNVSE